MNSVCRIPFFSRVCSITPLAWATEIAVLTFLLKNIFSMEALVGDHFEIRLSMSIAI